MSPDAWPVAIDGNDYWPVPVAWLDAGVDATATSIGPRVYAISVARIDPPRVLRVRYTTPRSCQVIERAFDAIGADDGEDGIEGSVPVPLRRGTWPRSYVPSEERPTDVRHDPETRLLRERWGNRTGDVPTDADVERELRPDGGLVVPFGGGDEPRRRDRRNPCPACGRSMSDRWSGEVCPFCQRRLECDEDGCDFRAASPTGLSIHYGQVHPSKEKPGVCR